jgi:hypothetical protein
MIFGFMTVERVDTTISPPKKVCTTSVTLMRRSPLVMATAWRQQKLEVLSIELFNLINRFWTPQSTKLSMLLSCVLISSASSRLLKMDLIPAIKTLLFA